MIDVIATEAHFAAHLAPVWAALPEDRRGQFITAPDHVGVPDGRAVLVASYGDHKRARALGYRRIARAEHGAGQSYGGDPRTATVPNYAGGRDADDVGLFLVPGPHPARRWQTAYPSARVEVVGDPRLDDLPRVGTPGRVAISFHFHAGIGCPEGDGTFRWYRHVLPELARRFDVIGHAHPRWGPRMRVNFERAGIPFVDDFAEVCRQASVYVCDNSSTIFEFASTDRPVVLLDWPEYRRTVEHGLRFWSAAHVGLRVKSASVLVYAIEKALEDRGERPHREDALAMVYGHRTGGAERAAAALISWERGDA